jgi:DNA-binding HxlR family transcriptional regulator
METLLRGEYNICGLRNKDLRQHLPGKSPGQISRLLKRLRLHGMLRKAGRAYRYCITSFGRQTITLALKLRELVIIPEFAALPAS